MCRHTHVQAYTCASIHIKKETKEEIKNTVRGWGVTQYVRGPGFVFKRRANGVVELSEQEISTGQRGSGKPGYKGPCAIMMRF